MKRNYFWYTVLACYVLFIYFNSMTPAGISSQESGFVLRMVQGAVQSMGLAAPWLTEHIIRKCAHFCEYAVFGLLLTHSLDKDGRTGQLRILLQILLTLLTPFIDETIQLFTPGRSSQISDVWLDISGAAAGTLVFILLCAAAAGLRRTEAPGKSAGGRSGL